MQKILTSYSSGCLKNNADETRSWELLRYVDEEKENGKKIRVQESSESATRWIYLFFPAYSFQLFIKAFSFL